jgi:hypothetical protein
MNDIAHMYEVKHQLMSMFKCSQEELQVEIDTNGIKEHNPIAYHILSTPDKTKVFKGFKPRKL